MVSGAGNGGNGVFRVGTDLILPNNTFGASNYWADVTFVVATAPLSSLTIIATDATKPEGDTGLTAYSFTVNRSGDTCSQLRDLDCQRVRH